MLDIGCSSGALAASLRRRFDGLTLYGIEVDEAFAKDAKRHFDSLIFADLDQLTVSQLPRDIDTFILADVIEHTKNPDLVLEMIRQVAAPNAQLILSVPNVQHWTVIKNLLLGDWPERERGIFDRTHLRFFTEKSLRRLFERHRISITSFGRNYRLFDSPRYGLARLAKYFGFWPLQNFIAYQFVVAGRLSKKQCAPKE